MRGDPGVHAMKYGVEVELTYTLKLLPSELQVLMDARYQNLRWLRGLTTEPPVAVNRKHNTVTAIVTKMAHAGLLDYGCRAHGEWIELSTAGWEALRAIGLADFL